MSYTLGDNCSQSHRVGVVHPERADATDIVENLQHAILQHTMCKRTVVNKTCAFMRRIVQCGEIETEVLQRVAKDGRLPAALVEDAKTGKAVKDSYRLACEPP
jgi:hypothetical protein